MEQSLGWCLVVCGPLAAQCLWQNPRLTVRWTSGGPGTAWNLETTFSSVENYGKKGIGGSMGEHTAPSPADLSRQRAIASPAGKPSPCREQRGEGELRGRCIYSSLLLYHPAGMQALGGQPAGERSGAGPCTATLLRVFQEGCWAGMLGQCHKGQSGRAGSSEFKEDISVVWQWGPTSGALALSSK